MVEGYGTGNTKQDNPGLVPPQKPNRSGEVGSGKGFTFTTPQVSPQKNKNLIVVSLDGLEGMEVEFFEGGGIFSVLPAGDVCEVLVIAGAFTGGRLVFGSEVAPA